MVCVKQDWKGYLVPTTDSLDSCTGWILMDAQEYRDYTAVASVGSEDARQAFLGVVLLWVVGLTVGFIISLIRKMRV
jgi:hypothetical protein